ncbi:ras-related protein Rab-7a isoform X1 [Alosa alosa]|uniref:ras-related protein Rab-7a isoform X1 n=1 Tax=Alosa alosa TaxID=278164 RepID=UPI00201526FE|nr:ras-related protein Rab-7a isoform X1 [Alosa alosa]
MKPEWRKPHLKVIMMGNSGVGKSSLMNRFVNHRFTNLFRATIGTDFLTKEISVEGRSVVLHIWDTAGTERFQSLGTAFFRASHCCLLVFDVTSTASFYALDTWLHEFLSQQVKPLSPTNFPLVVVGNKTDLKNRQVSREEAQRWCRVAGADYIEGSAKEDVNVEKSFHQAACAALQYFEVKEDSVDTTDGKIQISENPSEIRRDKCQC